MTAHEIKTCSSIFIMLIILCMSSCSNYDDSVKDYEFHNTFSFRVLDIIAGEAIDQAMIRIWESEYYYYLGDTIKGYTDEQGFYRSDKLNVEAADFMFEISKDPAYETMILSKWDYINEFSNSYSNRAYFDSFVYEVHLKPNIFDFRIIPDRLIFFAEDTSQSIVIMNTGTGDLTWTLQPGSESLIPDRKEGIILIDEFEIVAIGVDRSLLSAGNHNLSFSLTTNAGYEEIPVSVTVSP